MLRGERTEDKEEAQRVSLLGWQTAIWTAMPGILQSFDAEKMTCKVQPTIKGIFRLKDGTEKKVTMPECLDVPVQFAAGGGFAMTFPMKEGDEGIIVFASRCIDSWWQNGGIQNPAELRMHDLSDGMFIPGIRSVPRVLTDFDTENAVIRSEDNVVQIVVKADEILAKVGDDTSVRIKDKEIHLKAGGSTIDMTDSLIDMNADTIKLNGIEWDTHEHGGVQTGGAKTGGPEAP